MGEMVVNLFYGAMPAGLQSRSDEHYVLYSLLRFFGWSKEFKSMRIPMF